MRQIFLTLTENVTSISARLVTEYNPKDLHRLRIDMRRIRSLLKQVKDHRARHFRKAWGGFAEVTNQARDWDVFLISAKSMQADAGYQQLKTLFMPRVLTSHEAVVEVLQSGQWQRHLADWEQFVRQAEDHIVDVETSHWSIEKALSKARLACRLALSAGDERAWHKFRIALKNLRFIAEACLRDPACDQQLMDDLIASCKNLQARLGAWHDCVVQLLLLDEHLPDETGNAAAIKSGLVRTLEKKKTQLLRESRESLAKQKLLLAPDDGQLQ
jgi:CHAD domain-containing protein